jgi:DNA-binding response OmpR family regulator
VLVVDDDPPLQELTGRESALLELLLRQPGRTLTREQAIEEIWGGAAATNVVDRYVTRLRRKLGEPPLIHPVRGAGFTVAQREGASSSAPTSAPGTGRPRK